MSKPRDVKGNECQSTEIAKAMDVKAERCQRQWMSKAMDFKAKRCQRQWMSKAMDVKEKGCQSKELYELCFRFVFTSLAVGSGRKARNAFLRVSRCTKCYVLQDKACLG